MREILHAFFGQLIQNTVFTQDGLSCLMMAAKRGRDDKIDVIDVLVKAGAHPNEQENVRFKFFPAVSVD